MLESEVALEEGGSPPHNLGELKLLAGRKKEARTGWALQEFCPTFDLVGQTQYIDEMVWVFQKAKEKAKWDFLSLVIYRM